MKVLLVTTSFPQNMSGAEAAGSFVVDFSHELLGSADVAVVAPGGREGFDIDALGMPVYRYKAPRQSLSLLKPQNPLHWKTIVSTLASGKRITLKAAREFGADYILALWALPSGYWAGNAAKQLGIPYATWALGSDIWSLGRLPVVRTLLAKVMSDAEHRFADGYRLVADVESLCGKDCSFLPSARQLPACGMPLRHLPPYKVMFLGRWHRNKGIDLFMNALQGMTSEDWQRIHSVRIAGGGPLHDLVKEKTQQLIDNGRPVKVEGFKDLHQATEMLLWSDLVVIASRIESIPVIYSDALQARRNILATPVGDFPLLASQEGAPGLLTLTESISAASITSALRKMTARSELDCIGVDPGNPLSAAVVKLTGLLNLENSINRPEHKVWRCYERK